MLISISIKNNPKKVVGLNNMADTNTDTNTAPDIALVSMLFIVYRSSNKSKYKFFELLMEVERKFSLSFSLANFLIALIFVGKESL